MKEPDWETEIDTPATIAIIGGGPAAIEAALYGRFLGYTVSIFERGKVGSNLKAWSDFCIAEKWSDVTSTLGLAALEAQHGPQGLPTGDGAITYGQYLEEYLIPVAKTDLIYNSLQINSSVLSVSRTCCHPMSELSTQDRSEYEYRVLVDSRKRGQYSQVFDLVIDCSGKSSKLGMSSGGGLAANEASLSASMLHGVIEEAERESLAGKDVLLFGDGADAMINAFRFAKQTESRGDGVLYWLTPKWSQKIQRQAGPMQRLPKDILQFYESAKNDEVDGVVLFETYGVESLVQLGHAEGTAPEAKVPAYKARFQQGAEETLEIEVSAVINCADQIFSSGHYVGLDVRIDEASPLTSEPHIYCLAGASIGEQQLSKVRAAFAFIGGRKDLDLYESVKPTAN